MLKRNAIWAMLFAGRAISQPSAPRRARRGLSLFEAVLSLFIFIQVSNVAVEYMRTTAIGVGHRAETQRVAALADLGERFVRQDMVGHLADLATRGAPRQILEADLESAGFLLSGSAMVTPLRREIALWIYAPTAEEIVVLARAFGDTERPNIPTAQDGTGQLGWVSPLVPTRVQGIGLDWDVSALQTANGWPAVNDLVAVRYLSVQAVVRPYLHRAPLVFRGVDYSRMAGPLNMGGNAIEGAGAVDATQVTAQTVTAQNVTVADALTAQTLEIATTATVSGLLTAQDGTFTGGVTAARIDVSGDIEAARMQIAGVIEGRSAQITDAVNAASLSVTGGVLADTVSADTMTVDDVSTGYLTATTATVTNTLTADRGVFETITTGGCTGC